MVFPVNCMFYNIFKKYTRFRIKGGTLKYFKVYFLKFVSYNRKVKDVVRSSKLHTFFYFIFFFFLISSISTPAPTTKAITHPAHINSAPFIQFYHIIPYKKEK
nr:MAG TPA: hypothetical protein [Caudoviricetes sp.]